MLLGGAVPAGLATGLAAWLLAGGASTANEPLEALQLRLARVRAPSAVTAPTYASAADLVTSPLFAAVTAAGALREPSIRLDGISISARRIAALVSIDGKASDWMRVGEERDGVTLQALTGAQATFEAGQGPKKLALGEQTAGSPLVETAAGTSAPQPTSESAPTPAIVDQIPPRLPSAPAARQRAAGPAMIGATWRSRPGLARVIAAALAISLPASVATPVLAQAGRGGADAYTFAFQNAEISQVVQEVLGEAGVPFTIDPTVSGKISFRIEQRLTREQLVAALEAVLTANNIAMVRNGDMLVIAPQSKAKASAEIRQGAPSSRMAGFEIVAVPLGYAQPTEVARALEAVSDAKIVLYANDKLGLLLLGGSGQQLTSALETLKVFDQSAFQASKIRWYELTQAQAVTVGAELERIVQGAGLVGVAIVPLKRLNGVIVFGRSADSLDEIGKWVQRLDTPGKEVASTLWVYRPQHGSAETLARTLSGLFGGAGSAGGLMPAVSTSSGTPTPAGGATPEAAPTTPTSLGAGATPEDEVRISVDKEGNAILFFTSPTKWVQIQRVLNEIDRPQRQVFIEASIVEVTLGRQFQFGFDWSVLSKDFQISSVQNDSGAIGPTFPGISVTFINDDIEAAVRALGARTNIEVVSAPKIIALDNKTARLQIGDQVPVVTQSSRGTTDPGAPLVSNVDYRSTGVILNVTPRISGQDRLVLDVSQEVSNVAKTSTSGIDSPTIQQRRFESTLVLKDGGTVALGGLISTTKSFSDSGIPGLKDVPAIGALFRSEGRENNRSELIVLLRARIIADPASSDRAMADLAADMHELQNRGLLPFTVQ